MNQVSVKKYLKMIKAIRSRAMAVRNLKDLMKLTDKLDEKALKRAQRSMDAIATQKVVRKTVYE